MGIKMFKDELINDIIPRIENLREIETKQIFKGNYFNLSNV